MLRIIIRKFIQYHVFSILCGLGILILCTIQLGQQDSLPQFPNFDKVVHFTMYFVLSATVILETQYIKHLTQKGILRVFFTALAISTIFGGLIEIVQSTLTDYRSGDYLDWFFDVAGSVAACMIIKLIRLAFR